MPAPTPHYLPPHAYLALSRALARALPDIARPDLEATACEILADAGIWDERVLIDPARAYEIGRANVRAVA